MDIGGNRYKGGHTSVEESRHRDEERVSACVRTMYSWKLLLFGVEYILQKLQREERRKVEIVAYNSLKKDQRAAQEVRGSTPQRWRNG